MILKTPEIPMKKFFEPKFQGSRVMTTFQVDKELWNKFKMLMLKERRPAGNALTEFIETYVHQHEDGNPQFTIDQFKDPNFVACPAFFRDTHYWNYYFSHQTKEELEKFKHQIIEIDRLMARYL